MNSEGCNQILPFTISFKFMSNDRNTIARSRKVKGNERLRSVRKGNYDGLSHSSGCLPPSKFFLTL